jgi:hypothetical protein
MCDYCNPETREAVKKRDARVANELREIASRYQLMSEGRISPHGKDGASSTLLARRVIRSLAEDYL